MIKQRWRSHSYPKFGEEIKEAGRHAEVLSIFKFLSLTCRKPGILAESLQTVISYYAHRMPDIPIFDTALSTFSLKVPSRAVTKCSADRQRKGYFNLDGNCKF